jgi:hypothetical protein
MVLVLAELNKKTIGGVYLSDWLIYNSIVKGLH